MRRLIFITILLCGGKTCLAQADVSPHLTFGNPSRAQADKAARTNYLLVTDEWACSYNADLGGPNWVSWRLSVDDLGHADRTGLDFIVDPDLPGDFPHITSALYVGSGFDKGHGCPSFDRAATRLRQKRTFSTANCLAQAPVLNRGWWSVIEDLRRELAKQGNVLFIIVGPAGSGGRGEAGYRLSIGTPDRRVTVPALCWAVWLVIPDRRGNPLTRVTRTTEVRAVIFRNDQVQPDDWHEALVSVDDVEQLVPDLDLFDLLPNDVERVLEAKRPAPLP